MDAIPNEWKLKILTLDCGLEILVDNRFLDLMTRDRISSYVYNDLPTMLEKDQNLNMFRNINACTISTKLCDFQYRINATALVTNIQLKRWGVLTSDHCTFCNLQTETIVHLLFGCTKIQNSLMQFKNILKNKQ